MAFHLQLVRARLGLALSGLLGLGASIAHAQPYLTWDQVPYVYAQSPERFSALFRGAHCSTVRAILLGDSQETCPNGLGTVYFPRLAYELYLKYGNVPETPVMGTWGSFGGGTPPAQWLIRSAFAPPGPVVARFNGSILPPEVRPCASSTTDGQNTANNQIYGPLLMLQHDAFDVDWRAAIPHGIDYFSRAGDVYLDVIAATNPSSGEIRARVTPAPTSSPGYYNPTTQTFTSDLGLETPGPAQLRVQRFGPLATPAQGYLTVELSGTDPAKLTDLVAFRYVNASNPRGWALSTFATGSYWARWYTDYNSGCGPFLGVVNPDVLLLALGTNEGGSGYPTWMWRSTMENLIAFVRGATRSDLPVIAFSETRRRMAGNVNPTYFEQYAGVLYAMAQVDPNLCVVNSRRLTEEAGWDEAHLSTYVFDDVHHTPYGAITKAHLEVEALYAAFGGHCPADLDDGRAQGFADCAVDVNDLLYFLVAFEVGDAVADLDDGSGGGTPDGGTDVNDLIYFLAHFESGC